MLRKNNINLIAFVRPSTGASVGVWEVNMASRYFHDILDVVASLANNV